MTRIDVNNLLSQMRQMSAQVRPAETAFKAGTLNGQGDLGNAFQTPATSPGDFSALLRKSISSVAQTQLDAGRMAASFERGDKGADLGKTMIAVQKADLSLRTVVAVQSKLVDAYNQIMNMPM